MTDNLYRTNVQLISNFGSDEDLKWYKEERRKLKGLAPSIINKTMQKKINERTGEQTSSYFRGSLCVSEPLRYNRVRGAYGEWYDEWN